MWGPLLFVLIVLASLLFSGCAAKWHVVQLDVASDAAVAECAKRVNNLAGWLQQIDAEGNYVNPPAVPYCVWEE